MQSQGELFFESCLIKVIQYEPSAIDAKCLAGVLAIRGQDRFYRPTSKKERTNRLD